MTLDPSTPILVGAGVAMQRFDDPHDAADAIELIATAVRHAADDATPALLPRVGSVFMMKGMWPCRDPGRLVAARIGAPGARSIAVEPGVLQTSAFARAIDAVASGSSEVALVIGGEAKYRDLRATILGIALAPIDEPGDQVPDETVAPEGFIISPAERTLGLVQATHHYAMIENARRALDGQTLAQHAATVAELWAGFNVVARTNPDAWNRQPMTADEIRVATPKNRPLAYPYNKWHNSQWNVDQAAALLFTTVGVAQELGIDRDRWIFPHAIANSQYVVPITARRVIGRSPGFAVAGRAAFGHVAKSIDDVAHIDLYSCFPIAVRTQMLELGIAADRRVTETGGMTFAGGPLNNWVLQSLAKMVSVLRDDPGSLGLVTAISGMITKQGVSLWSTTPPASAYRAIDVTADAKRVTGVCPVVDAPDATATVASYTVIYDDKTSTRRGIVIADLNNGDRVLVQSTDEATLDSMVEHEWIGRSIGVRRNGSFIA
jgi:acetyl-CoA C-acetyltransferase